MVASRRLVPEHHRQPGLDRHRRGLAGWRDRYAVEPRGRRHGGSIVFNGSVFAELGTPGISIYSASKGGVAALARATAVELGPDAIRVKTGQMRR
ncbi:SDR family oxidoreductase [Streptomyces sp. NPDC005181]|uniref:SDR family oxidoreductase n=1 Tax=Streptomyces sp. NPDC005181 TaxID=3156869 RepID=UPI0033BBBBDE